MKFKIHNHRENIIAELISKEFIINNVQDAVDLIGNASFEGANSVIIFENQLTPSFFDLKTGIAGEILQKFSNYRMKLAIIGDFSKYTGKSLNDFILESNKTGNVIFDSNSDKAIQKLFKSCSKVIQKLKNIN